MPRRKRPNWRTVKTHRNYTADEAARCLGVTKGTVRRWIKTGGLPALTDQRPHLILGGDLKDFLKARKAAKIKCQPDELYCVKCRAPRIPADRRAQYISLNETGGNLRGLCPECGTLMHKRVSLKSMPELASILVIVRSGRGGRAKLATPDRPAPAAPPASHKRRQWAKPAPASPQARKRLKQCPAPCLNDDLKQE